MLICIGQIMPGAGKVELAGAPSGRCRKRSSRGRSPASACGPALGRGIHRRRPAVYAVPENRKAMTFRRWLQLVFKAAGPAGDKWSRFRAHEGFCPAVWRCGGKRGSRHRGRAGCWRARR